MIGGAALGHGDALRSRLVEGLTDRRPLPLRREHRYPHDWLADGWTRSPPAARATLARAMGELLLHEELAVRAGAVHFFQRASGALGRDALLQAFDHPELFEAMDPIDGRFDLRAELARALASRTDRTTTDARDRVRQEVLRPSAARIVLAAMGRYDRAWLVEHAEDVAQGSPDAVDLLIRKARLDEPTAARVQAIATGNDSADVH